MAANNSISLVSLDFDTLKNQLKTYLKSQAQFSDYDFDGSNMSVLLDILTYNTHVNAFYLNMVASEMFLDSAQLRNSIISIAKSLNYTPRSTKSAKAILNLQFAQSGLISFTIPSGTRFTGKNSRGSYQFITDQSRVLYPSNGFFTAANVEIYEGSLITDTFVVNYAIEGQRFILTNDNIDTDSLNVVVSEDDGQTISSFQKTTTLYNASSNTNIFFVQATEDTRYEVSFGDGVFGRRPKDGAIVTCTYRNTFGADGNDATGFILNDNLGAFNGYGSAIIPTITVVSPGFGGGEAETIEDIRFRAPKVYQTQERAITVNDFSALVTQEFQSIKNVYVYGGELALGAPRFGSVLIAPVTYTGVLLSQAEKNEIETYLRQRTTVGITPTVVDPDYLYVSLTTNVKYDPNVTTLSAADIKSAVESAIETFNTEELTDFNTELNLSKLESAINAVDASILGNQTELTIKKVFNTALDQQSFPSIRFRNEIVPGTIESSEFLSSGRRYQYADYNPNNNTLLARIVDGRTVVINTTNAVYLKDITNPNSVTYTSAGTVDYAAGIVTLNSIRFSSFEGKSGLEVQAKPVSQDVSSKENDVIAIDVQGGISVNVRSVNG